MAVAPDSSARAGLVPGACDLSSLNTLGLASSAPACVTLRSRDELPALACLARSDGAGLLVLGGGSNLVLPPRVRGLVARMALRGIRLLAQDDESRVVEAAAGEIWHDFVTHCVEQGWGGLENLALIPGTVGAAPVQNIGAYGVELRDRFAGLTAYDLLRDAWTEMDAAQCAFAYRDSVFKREPGRWVITAVRLRLPRQWTPVLDYPDLRRHESLAGSPTARDVFEAVCAIRRAKLPDPAVLGNAGSFFKNPVVPAAQYERLHTRFPGLVAYPQEDGSYKLAAGWLIDQCGWKGRRMGPVGVHERQALVLVNHGGAQSGDVLALARAVQHDVRERYGLELEIEPVVVPGIDP
ncbi:UDP-N-acetylmuramate dehydrogenase [Pigmentiphaga sp. D-2]|uniref:UDP-N-acetylmuramate dehydrogenase n=1 Tax=unclassified Pigmentiphaga TaxID=2626614 RepID=UPI001045F9AF